MLRQVAPGLQSELVHRSASGQPAEMLFPRLPRFRQWVKCANCTQLMTVNLAPADLRKEGPAYDLPIAVGLLMASEQLIADLARTLMIGELSLDGIVRPPTASCPWQHSRMKKDSIPCSFLPSMRPKRHSSRSKRFPD